VTSLTEPASSVSPSPPPSPTCAAVEEEAASPSAEEEYLSKEDVRAEYLSRFDSSTVSMLNEDTLLVIGPDGKKEFFEKKRQMGIQSGTKEHAVYSSRIDTLQE
jgi:hypothetical protein